MKKPRRVLLAVVGALLAAPLLWAWPWSRDMVRQIFIRPQHQVFPPPAQSRPVGWERTLSRQVAQTLRNPFAPVGEDVERGRQFYATYCAVCHGAQGHGDGPVAGGVLAPTDLTSERVRNLSDGSIYTTIRQGVGNMPAYYDRLTQEERWLVVLYVRTLGSEGEP